MAKVKYYAKENSSIGTHSFYAVPIPNGTLTFDELLDEAMDGKSVEPSIAKACVTEFMKAMKQFPSVIRTEYAYALLAEKDAAKAQEFERQFERCAAGYPYPNDIEAERELMQIARESGDVSTDSFIAE